MFMSYVFFNQLERVLNILVYSLTPTRYRHRRFDRNRYYRTLLQWDICSNRYVVNRSVLNQSLFSQASLHSLAALSSNQRNANYSTSNVIRGELPILSTLGIVMPPSDVNPILSSIARSLGLTTHSAAVTNGLVILILREMVRRGPPQGVSLHNITESELRDVLNAILRSASVNPQSVFTHAYSHSIYEHGESSNTRNHEHRETSNTRNHEHREPPNTQVPERSPDHPSEPSSFHSADRSNDNPSLSAFRDLFSSPEFLSCCVNVCLAVISALTSTEVAPMPDPADTIPHVIINNNLQDVASNSDVPQNNHSFSYRGIIISGLVILTVIWLGFPADGLSEIDPQLAFPT